MFDYIILESIYINRLMVGVYIDGFEFQSEVWLSYELVLEMAGQKLS